MITFKIHCVHEITTIKLLSKSDLMENNLNILPIIPKIKISIHSLIASIDTIEEWDIKIKCPKSWNKNFEFVLPDDLIWIVVKVFNFESTELLFLDSSSNAVSPRQAKVIQSYMLLQEPGLQAFCADTQGRSSNFKKVK